MHQDPTNTLQHVNCSCPQEQSVSQPWIPKKLNWTALLKDENIYIDSELYRKWNRNLNFEGQELLDKDLSRTRSNQEYFKKESTRQLLKRITTFYCVQNKVNYQQGLLEVVIPFALLKRKDFQTRKCYAYFNSFMKKYFPKVLTQKTIDKRKELPHAILAITLTQILLKFHLPGIYDVFKHNEIPLSMVVTQEILTVFAKNIPIPFVYEIYNFFINKQDKNYVLYMAIALIYLQKDEIIRKAEDDQLHTFVNKNLKKITSQDDLDMWFGISEEIESKTPKSFTILTKKIGFSEKSFFTFEDYEKMMKFEQFLIEFVMPVYREQIDVNPQKFIFCLFWGSTPIKSYKSIKIPFQQNSQEIILDDSFLKVLPQQKILVVGYTQQRQKQEKVLILNLINEINRLSRYRYHFMMFQERLNMSSSCQIY